MNRANERSIFFGRWPFLVCFASAYWARSFVPGGYKETVTSQLRWRRRQPAARALPSPFILHSRHLIRALFVASICRRLPLFACPLLPFAPFTLCPFDVLGALCFLSISLRRIGSTHSDYPYPSCCRCVSKSQSLQPTVQFKGYSSVNE